jgi:hypothetical protein
MLVIPYGNPSGTAPPDVWTPLPGKSGTNEGGSARVGYEDLSVSERAICVVGAMRDVEVEVVVGAASEAGPKALGAAKGGDNAGVPNPCAWFLVCAKCAANCEVVRLGGRKTDDGCGWGCGCRGN